MAQNDFLDNHVGKQVTGLKFDELISKLNSDVYGKEMRNDISNSVKALGSAITELHDGAFGSGVGWTDYQIGQLEKILKAAAYADTGIGGEINKLIASLRGKITLVSIEVSPTKVTVSAGDSFDDVKKLIKVTATLSNEKTNTITGYEMSGTLIQGKDCPISISYTLGDVTITQVITVTVEERVPNMIYPHFFGNVKELPVGTTYEEVKDSIYAELVYNDGHSEITRDLLLEGNTVANGKNVWRVTSNIYRSLHANLEFNGITLLPATNVLITYLLEGCSSTETTVSIAPGEAFKTFISADYGSIASLKVFVDGADYTSLFASDGKTIDIPSVYVTTNGRIIISAIATTDYNITYHLTNCTSSNTDSSISRGFGYSTIIRPNDGYEIDYTEGVTYAMMGYKVFPVRADGSIVISEASNDINIYGVAKPASSGEVTLTSISASYTGGIVPAGTTLSQLSGITVTATYSDGSTGTVTGYTLSGTLTAGQTNTVTVTYQGKTATFEVTVEAESGEQGVDVIATYGRAEGYRISTSGGANSALSGCVAVGAKNDSTGIIPYKVGDVFYIKGITFPSSETNGSAIVFYSDANGAHQNNAAQVIYDYENTTFPATFSYNSSTGVLTVRINSVMIANSISHPYLRFSLLCSDVSQLKVMKNEVI